MLNVTPLLSINSSIQTSWGPGLWPCTPPVSFPEAGEACPLAHPPHLAAGSSHMHKQTHTHTQCQSLRKILYTCTLARMHIFIYKHECMHACMLQNVSLHKVSVHAYLAKTWHTQIQTVCVYSHTHVHICRNTRARLPFSSSVVPLEDCAPFHWRCYGLLSARPFHGWLP